MTQLREAAGFALLIMGLVGWLRPIIPGTPFLIAGVAVLGIDHPKLQPWMTRLKRWRSMLRRRQP